MDCRLKIKETPVYTGSKLL